MPTITLPKTVNTRDTIWTLLVKWGRGNILTAGWFDSFPASNISGGSQINGNTLSYSMPVTISKSGNAIGLRIGLQLVSAGDGLKIALYSAGGSLLGSASTILANSDAFSIKEVALSPSVAVTATNYLIAFSVNPSVSDTISTNASSSVALAYTTLNYASFPAANLPGSSVYGANLFLGVQVQ